eukprot:1522485-Rhodomonas_salina.1
MMRTTTVCLVAILANAYLCGASSVLPMMRLRGGAQVWDSVQHFVSDVHAAERGGEERVVELLEKWQNVDARFKALVEQKNQEAKESMSESKDSEEDIEGIVDSKDPRLDMVTGGTLDLDDRGPLVVVEVSVCTTTQEDALQPEVLNVDHGVWQADAALAFIEGWSELSADAQVASEFCILR